MIKIGIHLSELVGRNEKTVVTNCGTIKFKGRVIIGNGSKLLVSKNAHLEIGHKFNVTGKMQICCEHNILIQDDCMFSWNVTMIDTDYHPIYDSKGHITNSPRPITIGRHVWVGCDCLILKGVNIADNCVISAGSIVRGNLESPNSIYGIRGLAIEKLKDGIKWAKEVF